MTNNIFVKFFLLFLTIRFGNANNDPQNDKIEINGKDCKIIEPIYNNTFDLNPLHSDFGHKIQNKNDDIFEFNICGNLSKSCSGNSNAAACLTRGKKQILLGTTHELKYRNGRMFFSFGNGEKCSNGKSYTLNVLIRCDYSLDSKLFRITPYAENDCDFYISWETPQGCLPEPEVIKTNTCSVKNNQTGHIFNLMPLSDENHRTSDVNDSFVFIINVCKPVLYDENAMCPPGSSICFVNKTSSDIKRKFLNFGTTEPNPILENGQLIMNFTSTTPCNSTTNITSIINFVCDPSIKTTSPDFMGQTECNYQFTWVTPLACSNTKPCFATHPTLGYNYDLSSLSGRQYKLNHSNNQYIFSVCSDPGSPCLEHSGACQISNGQITTLGLNNSELLLNVTGSPYLLYKSNTPCNKTFWSTKIEFICGAEGSHNEPKIIENTNCVLVIQFATELACQKQEEITCKARSNINDEEIDLTPLINTKENYMATVNESLKSNEKTSIQYYLNVCKPLVPQYGLSCPGGSAACRAVMGANTPEGELSLGYPDVSLVVMDKSHAQLKYLRGSQCLLNPKIEYSSSIDFYCSEMAGKGIPILQSIIDECHYQFNWETNVICPPHSCGFNNKTCEIFNEKLKKTLKVRNMNFTNNGKIEVKAKSKPFQIDICGPSRNAISDYAQSTVKVFFDANGPCGRDESIRVELRLICSEKESQSSIYHDSTCNLVLTQETPEVCPFLGIVLPPKEATTLPTTVTTTTATTTKTTEVKVKPTISGGAVVVTSTDQKNIEGATSSPIQPTSNSPVRAVVITTLVLFSILLAIAFIIRNPVMKAKIRNLFRRSIPLVQYTRVETNEEANLLLPQNGHFSESDDDLLI